MGTSECARAKNIIILSNRERHWISTFLYVIDQNGCVSFHQTMWAIGMQYAFMCDKIRLIYSSFIKHVVPLEEAQDLVWTQKVI